MLNRHFPWVRAVVTIAATTPAERESEMSRILVVAAAPLTAALVLALALQRPPHAASSPTLRPAAAVPASTSVSRRADDLWWVPPGFRLLNRLLARRSYPTMAWP